MINETIKNIIAENMNNEFQEYNENIRKRLIDTSLNSLEKNINELKNAINEKDKEKILFSSHTIKGIFLNTRCFDLAEEFNDQKLKPLSLDEIINKLLNALKKIILKNSQRYNHAEISRNN